MNGTSLAVGFDLLGIAVQYRNMHIVSNIVRFLELARQEYQEDDETRVLM